MNYGYEHENRKRKAERTQEFNQMLDNYYKYRPDYPEEVIKAIINKANLTIYSKLLEIGAGSGKTTSQFTDFGFEIVCIEPGADFVERGKTKFKIKKYKVRCFTI